MSPAGPGEPGIPSLRAGDAAPMIRLRQAGVLLLGCVLAAAMVAMGWWQLEVYTASGERSAAERASLPPVALTEVATPGEQVTEGFGRTVHAEGRYDPDLQVLVPLRKEPDRFRVVSGLRLARGGVLAVVRGVSRAPAPPPPAGAVSVTGVLLPSEDGGDRSTSVRLPLLAQTWPGPLVSGVVTADATQAAAQGLDPAPVDLPPAPGRLRNRAYAMQWWLFAGFAVLFAARVARDLGRLPEEFTPAPDAQSAGRPT
jgi:surfeit locus 1 family protein